MSRQYLLPILATLRIRQWVKNLFVLAPLVFAQRLFIPADAVHALIMTAAFCAASSAVYFFNDLHDREHDRHHPAKRHRPIASGRLPAGIALPVSAVLAVLALAGSLAAGGAAAAGITAGYLAINTAYSLRLKAVPYIDILCIAAGFLLRVAAGAAAVRVPVSGWILIITFVLAAYLGFGKRLHERLLPHDGADASSRPALGGYRPRTLFFMLVILEITLPFLFLAYTQSVPNHHRMVWSVPFLAGALHRFFQICTDGKSWESPTDRMLADPAFLAFSTIWMLAVGTVLYAG